MRKWMLGIMGMSVASLFVACAPQQQAGVQLIADNPIGQASATPNVIFITPTTAPTTIPTLELITPSATYTQTPTATHTPDASLLQQQCDATLNALYSTASELCLGKPDGYFCNGGSAPQAEPSGAIANSLGVAGAVVEADVVTAVNPTPLLAGNSGGIVYLHLGGEVTLNALLIGDVALRDNTPDGFPNWKNFVVTTTQHTQICPTVPMSTFVVQGDYGVPSNMVINGTSVDLNGTLVLQTSQQMTHFIALEGVVRLTINGMVYSLFAGQQLDVTYPLDDFRAPVGVQGNPQPLTWAFIQNLPIVLMDRPVLLPQPGYVETTVNTNMRTAPDESAQLMYQVPPGQVLDVLGKNSDSTWYHVRLGNAETGWMRADLLKSSMGNINVVYDATPIPPQRFGKLGTGAFVIAAQGGNLRQAPDTYFTTLTTLKQGTEVELVARSPYSPWVKVRANGLEGWLALIVLETQSVISFLPIDYGAPLPPRPTSTPEFQYGGGHAYPDPQGGQ
jgi:uncharacterized protein YgiM (DUF1202 family)